MILFRKLKKPHGIKRACCISGIVQKLKKSKPIGIENQSLPLQLECRAKELTVAIKDDDSKKISYLMIDISRIYDALQTNLISGDNK